MQAIEQLGVVTSRSGILIVIDTGYLNLWSHDRTPVLPDGALDTDEATERAWRNTENTLRQPRWKTVDTIH
jgi:hypothetical protein